MARQTHPWFRRSDGWWYVKTGGKQLKLARGRQGKQLALQRWHELTLERASNPSVDSRNHTVASIIDLYLTHSKRSYSASSFATRRYYLQRFAETHGFRPISECLPIHLTGWLDSNLKWKSDWTRAGVVSIVQRPFNWAVLQRLIVANPFRGVRHRCGEPRRPMTDAEFRSLLRATVTPRPGRSNPSRSRKRPTPGTRFRQVLMFLRYTGARPGEMASLTWDDVDLDQGVIVLRRHKTSRTQRIPRPRVIQLVPSMVKMLKGIQEHQQSGMAHVFLTARDTRWNRSNLGLRMRRLRERAGLPDDVKLYGIRHHFGTQSIINGVDIKTLAELMGHTTSRMTEHYVHLAGHQAHLAAAMQQAVGRHRDS